MPASNAASRGSRRRLKDEGPTSQTAAALEEALSDEKKDRRAERFYLLSVIGLLLWVICAMAMKNTALSMALLAVIVALEIGLAYRLTVTAVIQPLSQLLSSLTRDKAPKARDKDVA